MGLFNKLKEQALSVTNELLGSQQTETQQVQSIPQQVPPMPQQFAQQAPDEYIGAEGEEVDAGNYAGNYAGYVSFMVSVDGQVAGPYTIDELQQFVATGEFSPQVFVWRDGMAQWEIAGNVPELMNLFSY